MAVLEEIRVGAAGQAKVIAALMMRDMRIRNSRFAFAYFFDALEMVGLIAFMSAIHSFISRQPPVGDSTFLFITTGIVPVMLFRAISAKSAVGVKQNRGARALPRVSLIDNAVAKTLGEVLTFSAVSLTLLTVLGVFDYSDYTIPYRMEVALECIAMVVALGLGVGLVNAVIQPFFPLWQTVWGFVSRGQILFAAVFAIPEYMPIYMRDLLEWNPMAHIVAKLRLGFYPMYPRHFIDSGYVWLWVAGALVCGMMAQRALRTRLAAG